MDRKGRTRVFLKRKELAEEIIYREISKSGFRRTFSGGREGLEEGERG